MNKYDKNKIIALTVTAVLHVVVMLILVFSYLHYTYEPLEEKPHDEDITFYGGEYVMLGDVLSSSRNDRAASQPVKTEKPVSTDNDLSNSGSAGESSKNVVSSDAESPMKVEKKPVEKTGPTKEEIEEQERIKAEEEAKRKTNSKVKNAFGKSGSSDGGKEGSPNGNSSTGSRTGAPGISGLTGYTLSSWGRPTSHVDGKVVIRVRVNARGKVISASYYEGSGTAASSMAVRKSCENAAMQSAFSVPVGTTDEAVGYITWRFE